MSKDYSLATLTYEQAREMSIWRWKYQVEHDKAPPLDIWLKEFNCHPQDDCGFCQLFLDPQLGVNTMCGACPLFWKNAKKEHNSSFNAHLHGCRKCSRSFWKFNFWSMAWNNRWTNHWAKKLLAEIKATPEHMEEALWKRS